MEDQIATVTLADIYFRQGLYDRAACVYGQLLARAPYDPALAEGLRTARLAARDRAAVSRERDTEAPYGTTDH